MGKFALGFLAFAGLSMGQVPNYSPIHAKGKFETDKGVVEVLGVCKAGSESFQCWDVSGKTNPSLSAQMLAFAKKNAMKIEYRFGSKTRIVPFAVSTPKSSDPLAPYISSRVPSMQFYPGMAPTFLPIREGLSTQIQFATIETPEDQKNVDFEFIFSYRVPIKFSEPFKAGAKFDCFGSTLTFVKTVKTPCAESPDWKNCNLENIWTNYFTVDTLTASHFPNFSTADLSCQSIDNLAIKMVDVHGVPSFLDPSLVLYSGLYPPFRGDNIIKANYYPAVLGSSSGLIDFFQVKRDGSIALTTNVDPSFIHAITLGTSITKQVIIDGLPLDPK